MHFFYKGLILPIHARIPLDNIETRIPLYPHTATLKNHKKNKHRVSYQYWSRSPEKLQGYQASIQCWTIIGTPAKRHFMAFRWRADDGPLVEVFGSPHQLNKVVKVGHPLKKRSGSAHVVPVNVEEFVDTGPGKVVVIFVEGCRVVGGVVGGVAFGVFVVTVFTVVVGVAVVIGRPVVGGAVVEGCWVVTGGFVVVGAFVTVAVVLAVVGCAPPGVVTE